MLESLRQILVPVTYFKVLRALKKNLRINPSQGGGEIHSLKFAVFQHFRVFLPVSFSVSIRPTFYSGNRFISCRPLRETIVYGFRRHFLSGRSCCSSHFVCVLYTTTFISAEKLAAIRETTCFFYIYG